MKDTHFSVHTDRLRHVDGQNGCGTILLTILLFIKSYVDNADGFSVWTSLCCNVPNVAVLTLVFQTLTSISRFGAEMPFYINVVREPLQRLVSDYYFLRFHLADMFPMNKERRDRVNSISFTESG